MIISSFLRAYTNSQQERRRVSAPSDPPSGSSNSRGPRRKHRARDWRLKKRAGENSSSGSGSGTATSDEIGNATPAPPVNTPSEGAQTATTIRFAPGF